MAKASDLVGGGTDFTIPTDASYGTGDGWLIDPALNTSGVLIYTLTARGSAVSTEGHIGSNKANYLANPKVWSDVDGSVVLSSLKLAPGVGLYTTNSWTFVLFKYL
ncbi:hypothetical protein [Kordiimonas gwangyangensis]|uniref:hypothetical protein n=1 Tax=Kordiimonas gwangyangensis TaxID=288022 RepID=UPI00035CA9DB|nr:hypothetical protein [Kordiimonas gwangyangensis]